MEIKKITLKRRTRKKTKENTKNNICEIQDYLQKKLKGGKSKRTKKSQAATRGPVLLATM